MLVPAHHPYSRLTTFGLRKAEVEEPWSIKSLGFAKLKLVVVRLGLMARSDHYYTAFARKAGPASTVTN